MSTDNKFCACTTGHQFHENVNAVGQAVIFARTVLLAAPRHRDDTQPQEISAFYAGRSLYFTCVLRLAINCDVHRQATAISKTRLAITFAHGLVDETLFAGRHAGTLVVADGSHKIFDELPAALLGGVMHPTRLLVKGHV